MLSPSSHPAAGVSLVELLIGMAIFSTLLALAAPSFSSWIQNSQIRTTTETVQSGLQLARAMAVQRNTTVSFYLTTTLDNGCAVSASGTNWVVSLDDPSGACASAPNDTVAPRIVQKRSSAEGTRNAVMRSDQASIGFSGLGRRINAGAAANVNLDITNTTGGTCVAAGGPMRCLRIEVSTSGQVRMCDPAVASTDTRGC